VTVSTTTASLPQGSDEITAGYSGDSNLASSSSSPLIQTVTGPAATTTSLASSANPSGVGQPVTFTAMVSYSGPGDPPGTPTGSVTFSLDLGPPLDTEPLSGGGTAQFTTSALAGSHTIIARYSGDVLFSPSTGTLALTTTSVVPSANPSVFGQPVTFTATVSPIPPHAGPPTGSVTFYDGGSPIDTEPLSGGTAQFTTSALAGSHTIIAVYSGDLTFAASSGSLAENVKPLLGSFAASPGSGPAGSSIGIASVTPCPDGSTAATLSLTAFSSLTPALTTAASLDLSGFWAEALVVPGTATAGTVYVLRALCVNNVGQATQNYAPATFVVDAPVTAPAGRQEPTGATDSQGTKPAPAGPTAPKRAGVTSTCSSKASKKTTCKFTFTFAASSAPRDGAVVLAVARIAGHSRVIARGHLRHRSLTLVFRHLRRGRYQLTLIALGTHGKRTVIGHSSIVVR